MTDHIPAGNKTDAYIARERQYLAQIYKPLSIVLNRGDGVWLWDTEGRKYLDFLSAYSAVSFGHLNARIKQALMDQLDRLDIPARAFHTDRLGEFAQTLCEFTGMDVLQPMNSGAEAVETAVKVARRWGHQVKGIADGRQRVIVSAGNFHGRTTTIISFSSDADYKRGFGPLTPGFDIIPFGDLAALEAAITPDTCAFLTEPIQGEGGILMPPPGFLKAAQDLCRKHDVLFFLDEIQTGMGRTGRDFCFQHEIDKPDGLMLGKALGGGIYPVSAFLARRDVMDVLDAGSHGSTFGGNPIAAAIGIEAIKILRDDRLSERAAELGEHMLGRLRAIKSPLVRDVRGRGLLIGMEIDPARATARQVCDRLLEKGLLSKDTHGTVVRFAPPLIIEREQLDWAADTLAATLAEMA
ncbi:MAG: ornithine--oxo-acid transaminase [Rhodospirillales bacterium]|nr:ornithine--oxo-acid transaminase [Alphaproteobacteria bacterium]MCB9986313.1 ornithine--oxo-acid transaminase [Rhodospirillales bacterium]USO07134.1 MAG: ornithine--oxo-acid transaminase [Rhodospirillales bacterium]